MKARPQQWDGEWDIVGGGRGLRGWVELCYDGRGHCGVVGGAKAEREGL